MCALYSHSETEQRKSLWTHQREQVIATDNFQNQVVIYVLSNHNSNLFNQGEENRETGNCGTCWAHSCDVVLKLRHITRQVPDILKSIFKAGQGMSVGEVGILHWLQ